LVFCVTILFFKGGIVGLFTQYLPVFIKKRIERRKA
jgi:hypothetical protein